MSTEHPLDAFDDLTGEEYAEAIAEFKADKAAYCRAVDTEGCACIPRPNYPVLADLNRWCRKHGILVTVPAELTQSVSGVRGGEPCMVHTRVPVEDVSTLLEDGATWEQVKDIYPSIPTPEAPREAAQPPASGPETSGTGSGRGTGVPEAQNSRQAIDDLNSKHWLKWNTTARTITGCQCGFGADVDSDCGFGDSVVAHLLEVGAEASRPVHYREAAASLRKIADADEKAEPPIGGEVDYLRGWRHAANRIESVAKDLEDGE